MLIGFDSSNSARDSALTPADTAKLQSGPLSLSVFGQNSYADNGEVWIGTGGVYQNTFINNASQDLILVVWRQGYNKEFVKHHRFTADRPKPDSRFPRRGGRRLVSPL